MPVGTMCIHDGEDEPSDELGGREEEQEAQPHPQRAVKPVVIGEYGGSLHDPQSPGRSPGGAKYYLGW